MELLTGARLKLARAREHHERLEAMVLEFARRKPYGITGYFDPESSEYVFVLKVFEHPPPEIAVVFGDLAQNVRASLDHVAWDLVLANGETPGRHTQFPIFVDPEDYRNKAPARLAGMSASSEALIEGVQPFNAAPNDESPTTTPMWYVNEVARIDRHQVLHTATVGVVGAVLSPVPHSDVARVTGVRSTASLNEPLQDGTEILRAMIEPSGPAPKMYVKGSSSSDVVIEHPGLPRLPLSVAASGMVNIANSVLGGAIFEVFRPSA